MNNLFLAKEQIDWAKLRKQKLTLVQLLHATEPNTEKSNHLEGVINLLDFVQDSAVESGIPSNEIFGDGVD